MSNIEVSQSNLSGEQIEKLKAAYVSISSLESRLSGVCSEAIVSMVNQVKQDLHEVCAPFFEQEEDDFERKSAIYESVQKKIGASAQWSDYSVEDFSQPHPYTNVKMLVYENHWGKNKVAAPLPEGGTWEDLYRAANTCIEGSGDTHHIFIESFTVSDDVLKLHTGS